MSSAARETEIAAMQIPIRELAEERRAVILAHNYQIGPIQDIADILGDSLGLAREAAKLEDAEFIVFCGVHFMAETAAILAPDKKVLLPDLDAGCFLADTITADALGRWKADYPDAVVVSYVNSTAAVKALTDYCCTSGNAVQVAEAIPADREILFVPDMFLGSWVSEITGRENIHLWPGECHVHSPLTLDMVLDRMAEFPEAEVMIHPESRCSATLQRMIRENDDRLGGRDVKIFSTGGMVNHAREKDAGQFIVGTELGIIYRMEKENPGKAFFPVSERAVCQYMKRITLPRVLNALENLEHHVTVDPETAAAAKLAVDRMIAIT